MVLVITYDNAPTASTKFYLESLKKKRWQFESIGEGEKWFGFVTRMKAYKERLETVEDQEIVILTDARDVFCLRSPRAFERAFSSFQKDMVVSM